MMTRIFRQSLSLKLLLPSLMALLPVMGLLWWLGQTELEKELAHKKTDLLVKSAELNERFGYQIRQAEIALQTLAQSPILRKLQHDTCQERVEQHFKVLSHSLANLLVLNPQGMVVCNAKAANKLHDLSDRAYYKRAMQTQKFAVGNFNIGKTTGTHIIGMAYPVVIEDEVQMLAATSLELSFIVSHFNKILAGSDFELTMIDINGVVLSHWQKSGKFVSEGTDVSVSPLAQHLLSQPNNRFFEMPDLLGNDSYFAYQPLTYHNQTYGYLTLSYHKSELTALTKRYRQFQFAAILFLFVMGLGIAALMLNRLFSQRLTPMMKAVKQLGRGELGVQLPVDSSNDELSQLAMQFNEMSVQLVKQQDHLLHVAYYDVVTQVHNKHYLQEQLLQLIENSHKHHLELILLDMDDFRLINDSLGHDKGDLLLIEIAGLLNRLSEEHCLFAHVGADEFAFLLIDSQAEVLQQLLAQIARCFEQSFVISGNLLTVSASVGISSYPEDALDAVTLYQYADAALHKSKREGKKQHQFYSVEMKQELAQRLMLENGLRHALNQPNELVLHYQPQVDVAGEVRHFEALIRWHHPKLGMISPQAFIPIAEQSTLIIELGNWVLKTACQQMRTWLSEGYKVDYVSVNVSAMQLHVGDLRHEVQSAIQAAGIEPQHLELEITESFVMKYPEQAIEVLTQLKSDGVRLAMDDFGTGYSSMLYLKRLPLDCMKIDQGFVRDMLQDPHDAAIVQAVVALGHSFGLTIVAEGVETQAHADRLRSMGCELLQGYLFSRPVPAIEAAVWLQQVSAG